MGKNKTLTIYNSDRYFNIHAKTKDEFQEYIKVTRLNEDEIEKEMNGLEKKSKRYKAKTDKKYMLFNEHYNNDRLIEKICAHSSGVIFYTDTVVPYYIFKQLSNNKNSTVVYQMKEEFTDKQIDNISLSYMGVKVVIDVAITFPYVNPYLIVKGLYSLKMSVDEIHLSFPRLTSVNEEQEEYYFYDGEGYDVKPDYKYDFTTKLRLPLSVWKMYLYIITNTDKDYEDVSKIITKVKKENNITS